MSSTTPSDASTPGETRSVTVADRLLLQRAVELAGEGTFSVTANPRVGCLLVKDGTLLGRGYHQRGGDAHAEVNALRDAQRRGLAHEVAGATAYVSLEPCCHAGRTPACTSALIDAGIARVVIAMLDPHPKVDGEGVGLLRAAGIQVDIAELDEARRLNYGHTLRMQSGRPYVRLKIAQSLDGRTAMASGESKWITGPQARRDVQYWRARSGAVITGAGTVVADDPSLLVREQAFGADIDDQFVLRQPLRVVLDPQRRCPHDAQVFTDGAHTLRVVSVAAGPPSPAQVADAVEELALSEPEQPGRIDLPQLLAELGSRGCNEVLVEAGSTLVGAFLALDLWDEIVLYSAPKLLGSDARPMADITLTALSDAIDAKLASVDIIGSDVRARLVRPNRSEAELDCPPLGVPDTLEHNRTENTE